MLVLEKLRHISHKEEVFFDFHVYDITHCKLETPIQILAIRNILNNFNKQYISSIIQQ